MEHRCTWRVVMALVLVVLEGAARAGDSSGVPAAASSSSEPEAGGRDGRAGAHSVLADIAREMVMRSATSSQVLSLNLTNLLILLILKALLFGAGVFSFGFLKNGAGAAAGYGGPQHGGHYGRSAGAVVDDVGTTAASASLDEPEALLMLSFLLGDASRQYDCLYRVACEQPRKAREYAMAARALVKSASLLSSVVAYDPRYETIATELQKAADYGLGSSDQCSRRYTCDSASKPAD